MSRNHIHKTEGKFNNGLIELEDIPQNVRNKWDRHNKSIGKFRKRKKDIEEKQLKKIQ
jgi:predicted  nucleic acid-binding Zn-ribbon protein